MERSVLHVLLIANMLKPEAAQMVEAIQKRLSDKGVSVTVTKFNGTVETPDVSGTDLIISLGGDGTVLFSSRIAAPYGIPILAVNLGDFGFITEISKNEWEDAFDQYRSGELGISARLMLSVDVEREGRTIASYSGLNDAVLSSSGISKVIRLDVSLGDTTLGKYKADGIIISTPTGSTAYSVAAGGPILEPEMEALIINPICPFTLSNRPIVVPAEKRISVSVCEQQRTEVILTIDGQILYPLNPRDRLTIQRCPAKASIIRSNKRNFFEVLREKLKWSGGTDA
jgi:NAD+ kinase